MDFARPPHPFSQVLFAVAISIERLLWPSSKKVATFRLRADRQKRIIELLQHQRIKTRNWYIANNGSFSFRATHETHRFEDKRCPLEIMNGVSNLAYNVPKVRPRSRNFYLSSWNTHIVSHSISLWVAYISSAVELLANEIRINRSESKSEITT